MKKLAIIGCGGIGNYHMGHFLQFTDFVELAGFCDLIPERAQAFQEKAGTGKAYTDYKVMLDEVKPDMVFVCVPPYCHGEIEFDLIERGIHFFVEKPLALDLDLARKIRDAAAAKGLITASGFQCRYSNLVEPNKAFVENNQVVFVEASRMGGIPGVDWWRKKDLSGGQIAEQTIHQFDIIRYMIGDPEEVFTYGARGYITDAECPGYDTDDLSTTVVKFKNGIIGVISTGCYSKSGNCLDSKVTFSTRDKRAELKILGTLKVYGEKPAEPAKDAGGFVVMATVLLPPQARHLSTSRTAMQACSVTVPSSKQSSRATAPRSALPMRMHSNPSASRWRATNPWQPANPLRLSWCNRIRRNRRSTNNPAVLY